MPHFNTPETDTIVVGAATTFVDGEGNTQVVQNTLLIINTMMEMGATGTENVVTLLSTQTGAAITQGADGSADYISLVAVNATIEYLQANNIVVVDQIQAAEVDAVRIEGDRIFSGTTDITDIFIDNSEFAQEQEKYEELIVDFDGQTVWILNETINAPEKTELFVNGIKSDYLGEFTISGDTMTWLDTHYIIETTDDLEIIYK